MVDIYNQFRDFKSFEIVFKGENGPQKIYAGISSIKNDRIDILANNERNHEILAEVGTELKLYIYSDNGIYTSTSKILARTKGLINTEYTISYPTNSKHSQRREYFRADLAIDFKMDIYLDDTRYNKLFVEGKTQNICGKGLSFISTKPFVDYNEIDVELKFDDKTIKTSAELVYSQRTVKKGKQLFIHAFTFTTIRQSNIEYIVKKCFLHQLDLRKKDIM